MPRHWDEKFTALDELLLSGGHEQARARTGVPFIVLLYPPEEELQVRDRIDSLEKKLVSKGWEVVSFQPEPLLFEFLRSKGKLEEAFDLERDDAKQLRSNVAADLFISSLSELGCEAKPNSVLFVRRAGGFYPHVNLHSLHERLVNRVKRTTFFFLPATETEGNQYFLLGVEKTQKYRGHYL
jgi:hypothetical protein